MKTFFSAIVGVAVCFVLTLLLENGAMELFPPRVKIDPNDPEQVRSMMDQMPMASLIAVIMAHGIGTFMGLFIANLIQKASMIPFLIIILLMIMGTVSNYAMIPHPTWFMIADTGSIFVAAGIAWGALKWR